MLNRKFSFVFGLFTLFLIIQPAAAQAIREVYRADFLAVETRLSLEILDDDLIHFEWGAGEAGQLIWTSPMVAKTDYAGATSLIVAGDTVIETAQMRVEVDTTSLCLTLTDLTRTPELRLTQACPSESEDAGGLTLTPENITDVYGLGQFFQRRGGANGNLGGLRRLSLNSYGNALAPFNGGNVGNTQFPIAYFLGDGHDNYALFLDDVYGQYWNFSSDPFSISTPNQSTRGYFLVGEDLADLRSDYLELTGRPPVPPKQMFGLWVSEYGYDNWDELNGVLEGLRAENFPVDGFVLDLLWFGGIGEADGAMGSLAWDEENFPDPATFIAALRAQHGAGMMTIEESYVIDSLPDYADLTAQGVLVRQCPAETCPAAFMDSWWGKGGMVDWSNPEAAAWWHDNRRQHLIDEGVIGHWTDLGEPEDYNEGGQYYGFPELNLHAHGDVHNVYNLFWTKSIWDGYQTNGVERRPFILTRSGTSGSQRYGAAMWSGDIGANMPSLETHMNAQLHMSLSGMDYFGSDVGGFYRQAGDVLLDETQMYTIWLANSALLDVPLRPHAMNTQNRYQTSPAVVGDVASNLANIRLRYELSPYLYTLAHQAYRDGTPLFAPLVYHYQDDPEVRKLGSQKMLGRDVMMATLTGYTLDVLPVYLPAGGWFNYYTGEYFESMGEWVEIPTLINGIRRAPLFVRDGAILPLMLVDDDTYTVMGFRRDGTTDHSLMVKVFSHAITEGSFTLIEDDGKTMAYQSGAARETTLAYQISDEGVQVEISPATGSYADAPESRAIEVRLVTGESSITNEVAAQTGLSVTLGSN